MIRTKGLSHINLNVSDIERSARFYQEVFGLELLTAAFHAGGAAARAEFVSRPPVGRVNATRKDKLVEGARSFGFVW